MNHKHGFPAAIVVLHAFAITGVALAAGSPISGDFAPANGQPVISSFSPTSGPVGTVITINGSDLSGVSQAWVGSAHDAGIGIDTATSVQVTVPADAVAGPAQLAVDTPAGWAFSSSTFAVTAPSGLLGYAYVANLDGTISEYTIQNSGLLQANGPAIASAGTPFAVTVDPAGPYAYVGNINKNTISQYTVLSSGQLQVNGSPVSAVGDYMVVDPTGHTLYALSSVANLVQRFSIGGSGSLTPVGTYVPTGEYPVGIVFSTTGHYVYVINSSGGNVSEYTVGTAGALVANGTAAAEKGPIAIAIDPVGRYVYVVNQVSQTVSEYSIGRTGRLSRIGTIATGILPTWITVEPSGRHAYVTNATDNTVSAYSIGSTGALAAIGTVSGIDAPESIAVDPTGHYAYVIGTGGVSEYAIGPTGLLTATGTIAAGVNPFIISIAAAK